jgi:hypothetical protein
MNAEEQLHQLLGQLVHSFARFDFNVGLQLKWIGPYRGVEIDHLLVPRVHFSQRFEALKPLLLEVYGSQDLHAHAAFTKWFARAEEAKAMRNGYAHGRWGIPSAFQAEPYEVEFISLGWELDPAKQPPAQRMRLDELAEEVRLIESLFAEFSNLERRFRRRATPPKRSEEERRK